MATDQEELRKLANPEEIKNELVRNFTKKIEEPEPFDEHVVRVKMVVLGPTKVGKTSWLTRLIDDKFNQHEPPTIGAKFSSQGVAIEETEYHFEIWDVSGEDWCRSLCPMYLQHCHVAVVCYDPSDPESFEDSKEWVQYVKKQGDRELIICFVGMKQDLSSVAKLPVTEADAEKFFIDDEKQKEMFFFPDVSAKTDHRVQDVILTVAEALDEKGVPQQRFSSVNPETNFGELVDNTLENPHAPGTTLKRKDTSAKIKQNLKTIQGSMKTKGGQCWRGTKKNSKKAMEKTQKNTNILARKSRQFGSQVKLKTITLIRKVQNKESQSVGVNASMREMKVEDDVPVVDLGQPSGPKIDVPTIKNEEPAPKVEEVSHKKVESEAPESKNKETEVDTEVEPLEKLDG